MKKENRFPYGKRPFSSSPYNKLCQLVSMLHLRKRPGKYRICIAHKPLESTFPMRGATYSVQFSYIHHSYLNPRSPCGERLTHPNHLRPRTDLNPRSPCGERLWQRSMNLSGKHLNPRSPCGERQQK